MVAAVVFEGVARERGKRGNARLQGLQFIGSARTSGSSSSTEASAKGALRMVPGSATARRGAGPARGRRRNTQLMRQRYVALSVLRIGKTMYSHNTPPLLLLSPFEARGKSSLGTMSRGRRPSFRILRFRGRAFGRRGERRWGGGLLGGTVRPPVGVEKKKRAKSRKSWGKKTTYSPFLLPAAQMTWTRRAAPAPGARRRLAERTTGFKVTAAMVLVGIRGSGDNLQGTSTNYLYKVTGTY